MIRTEVGDKYVLQEMLRRGINLGGEQSGHIIILEHTTTGDGLIVALELIKVMLKTKKSLTRLSAGLEKFPQILINLKVEEKIPFDQIPGLNNLIADTQTELGQDGRLLVRYSGTENLVRIMVEGKQYSLVDRIANSVAGFFQETISAK